MALDSTYKQLPEELSERVRWLNEHSAGEASRVLVSPMLTTREPCARHRLASRGDAESATRLGCRALDAT